VDTAQDFRRFESTQINSNFLCLDQPGKRRSTSDPPNRFT